MSKLTADQHASARSAFLKALGTSVRGDKLHEIDLFASQEARFIHREVQRKLLDPQIRNGGDYEEFIVKRLETIAADEAGYVERLRKMAYAAAQLWKKILPPPGVHGASGFYYSRKPLAASDKRRTGGDSAGPTDYSFLQQAKAAAVMERKPVVKWLCQVLLDGPPAAIGDFRMDPLFSLHSDGTVSRLVKLRNVSGETAGPIALSSEWFHSSQTFREWLLSHGNFAWKGNQTEVDDLHEDINRQLAHTTVHCVPRLGWHDLRSETGEVDGIWIHGDCAYRNDQRLTADRDGIYWIDGLGYRLADRPTEGTEYGQGKPMFWHDSMGNPIGSIMDCQLDLADPGADEQGRLRGLFIELSSRMGQVLGSMDAFIALGSMLAFAAAPEIYRWRSQFPGLWTHGKAGSGKSTIMRDLMWLWGFNLESGLELKQKAGNTATGMLIRADQYSNVPVWLDEFRRAEVDPDKVGVIHAAFNRGSTAKWSPSGVQRKVRTAFVVSGESTTNDSGLRQRYPHIHITAEHREKLFREQGINHLEWFIKHREHFRYLVRHIMEHRNEFVRLTLATLRSYIEDPVVTDDRIKFVSGTSYAAWTALNTMLEAYPAQTVKDFRKHCQDHMKSSMAEVESDSNISRFWNDLIVAVQSDAVRLENFKVELDPNSGACSPTKPNQTGWKSHILYMWPEGVLSDLAIFMRKKNESVVLSRKDLQTQMSVQRYWMPGHPTKWIGGASARVWGIMIDFHPMGYQEVTDAEWQDYQSLNLTSESAVADPRFGELWVIVKKVLDRQNHENK